MQSTNRLVAQAQARYGAAASETPAMQTTLAGAGDALARLDGARLELGVAGPRVLTPPAPQPTIWRGAIPKTRPSGDLHDLTATEATVAMRRGDFSPVDLIQALLDRAAAVDGTIAAWERLDPERSLGAARAIEATRGGGDDPATGLPIGIKDIFDTAGLRTAAGFGPYDQRVPERDAACVAALRVAGAIILGKTVATQFAFTDPSRTHNPWSPEHTPGGSSSGSGAAVAAREVPWAVGSQTAGSTLRPAAYNGVVGFKPSAGWISTAGGFPLAWSLDTVGIITRCVADCALFLAVSVSGDLVRGLGLADPSAVLEPHPTMAAPRLGLVREWVEAAAPEVRDHVLHLAARLERAGAHVHEVRLPYPNDLIQAVHRVTILTEIAAAYSDLWERQAADLGPVLRAGVQTGRLLPSYAYVHAQRHRSAIAAALETSLVGLDAYLLPTVTNVAPSMETTGDPSLQVPATLVGQPAISLPTGLSQAGLPLAIQLVGGRGQDLRLLNAAAWCEAHLDLMPAPAL